MTIILAAALPNGAILAADSMRSIAGSSAAAKSVNKLRELADRTYAAKGGYGDLSDPLWAMLEALPNDVRSDADRLAEAALEIGQPIYEACRIEAEKRGEPDLGLYLIIVGLDPSGSGVIKAVDMRSAVIRTHRPPSASESTLFGIGSIEQAPSIAAETASGQMTDGCFDAAGWVMQAVQAASDIDPDSIAFPAYLAIVTADDVHRISVAMDA